MNSNEISEMINKGIDEQFEILIKEYDATAYIKTKIALFTKQAISQSFAPKKGSAKSESDKPNRLKPFTQQITESIENGDNPGADRVRAICGFSGALLDKENAFLNSLKQKHKKKAVAKKESY